MLQYFSRILIAVFFLFIIYFIFVSFLLNCWFYYTLSCSSNSPKTPTWVYYSVFQFLQWLPIVFIINYRSVIAEILLHCLTLVYISSFMNYLFNQQIFTVCLPCARKYFQALATSVNSTDKRPLLFSNIANIQMQYPISFRSLSKTFLFRGNNFLRFLRKCNIFIYTLVLDNLLQ